MADRYVMTAKGTSLTASVLKDTTIQDLKTQLRGALLLPEDAGYEETRQVWNGMIDKRPALIVRCTGVADVLAFIAARDIPQVVLSDYHAHYKLESLGLEDRFASTYVGESMGFVKPSPVGFQRIAADYGIPAESLLHIGDRADTDGAGSRAAGCQCRILGRDFRGFDVLLEELRSTL